MAWNCKDSIRKRNLFVAGAIESCGTIVHAVNEVVAALRAL